MFNQKNSVMNMNFSHTKSFRLFSGTLLACLCIWMATRSAMAAQGPMTLSLKDVLSLAENYNPDLRAAKAEEAQAKREITIQKSFYYPTLEAQGLVSSGFPGSTQHGLLGTGGLMDSPFAETPSGGLLSRLNILDLTIPFKVKSARYNLEAAKDRVEIVRYGVDWQVLTYYFNSMRYHGAYEVWSGIQKRVQALTNTVEKQVRTGQHNLADQYLIETQLGKAQMETDAYLKRYRSSLDQLGSFIGKKSNEIETPSFKSFDEGSLSVIAPGAQSAFILKAAAEAESAHSLVSARKAEDYPRIAALGSVGGMAAGRGVPVQDYAGGVGVTMPLFEGYRIEGQIKKAESFQTEKDEQIKSLQLYVDEANARYDTAIAFDQAKLNRLSALLKVTKKAFTESSKRYLGYVGPLVDVRDAIRYLSEIQNDLNNSKTSLWFNLASKSILNGGKVSP